MTSFVPVDEAATADLLEMRRSVPEIGIAREVVLSMLVCGPFTFRIKSIGLESSDDMTKIIARYWMPWQRKLVDWIKTFGVCPYYFIMQGDHPIPIIPDMDAGRISVGLDKKRRNEYKWNWTNGATDENMAMLWVVTDSAPSCTGVLQSALSSLLP